MDKLTRYFMFGGILIVVGVGMVALSVSGSGLPSALAGSLSILGVVALAIGFVMVVGALVIDLTQLSRERSKMGQPSG